MIKNSSATFNNERIVLDGIAVDARHANAQQMRDFAARASREDLIAFCVWNDRNGCFTDEQMMLEFDRVATDDELRAVITEWSNDL